MEADKQLFSVDISIESQHDKNPVYEGEGASGDQQEEEHKSRYTAREESHREE